MPRSPKNFLSRSRHSSPYRVTWTDEIFKKSDDAEDSLCKDRSAFVLRNDIMKLIPRRITRYMTHSGPEAQIRGFEELFLYLNKDPSSAPLRELIHAYFNDSPSLRGHLSQSSLVFSNRTVLKKRVTCREVRCQSIPEPRRRRSQYISFWGRCIPK